MDELNIGGAAFYGYTIPIRRGAILLIRGGKGMLGCGYFSLDAAVKFGDALAIVSGVKNYDDMLAATVKAVSPEAESLGIKCGMSGKEALMLMQ